MNSLVVKLQLEIPLTVSCLSLYSFQHLIHEANIINNASHVTLAKKSPFNQALYTHRSNRLLLDTVGDDRGTDGNLYCHSPRHRRPAAGEKPG